MNWRPVRRILIALASLATLLALFYSEENWRGRRAWEQCRREAEAAGLKLDWAALIPPAVPDDQNIFKAPRMQEWFVGRGATSLSRSMSSTNTLTAPIGTLSIDSARDFLRSSAQFTPDFDLIREALKRPYARADGDYSQPMSVPIPNFITLRVLAQTLAKRAQCDLVLGKPEDAVHELALMRGLSRLLEGGPTGKPMTLLAAMIDVAISGLYADAIADGFRLSVWKEPELSELQGQLGQLDLLPILSHAFASGAVATSQTLQTLSGSEMASTFKLTGASRAGIWMMDCMPRGWVYQNMVATVRIHGKLVNTLDLVNDRVRTEALEGLSQSQLNHFSPYTFVASIMSPNYIKADQVLALNQTKVNEALLSCALERYRLARGEFPDALERLMPDFIGRIPADVIGGQPLHYRRINKAQFTLYSVGWDGKDSGGQALLDPEGRPDLDRGDWVWLGWK